MNIKPINSETRLFFDASVLLAGIINPEGGSGLITRACAVNGFSPLVSQPVLLEVEGCLNENFPKSFMERFHCIVIDIPWIIAEVPSDKLLSDCEKIINQGDAHVLAAAITGRCDFLLTLDRKHFITASLKSADLPFIILTPGEFITNFYHLHEEFDKIPKPRK
ncbi:MAG: PIN domain-containing protein [Actinobacteria bacterium]|nr:PIN domain-containing protein [Actinomycetota bacterium]